MYIGAKKAKRFQGWIMVILATVAISVVGNFWSNATTYANTVMMSSGNSPIDSVTYGFAYTLSTIIMAVGAQLGGWVNSKYGPKVSIILASVCGITSGLILSNFINGAFTYILTYSVLGGLAYALVANSTCSSICNNWFIKRRGMANSIINFGTVFAGILTPQIVSRLIKAAGGNWHVGHWFYGGTAIIGLLVALIIVVKPSEVGQYPDNLPPDVEGAGVAETKKRHRSQRIFVNTNAANHWTYGRALKSPFLWLTIVASLLIKNSMNFMMNPGTVLFTEVGWTAEQLTNVLSLRQVFRFVFIVALMWLLDRFEPTLVMVGVALFGGVSYILCYNPTQMWQIYLFYIAGSILMTANMTAPMVYVANYFGNTNYAKILGSIQMVSLFFGGFSSTISGMIKSATGFYQPGFHIWAIVCLVGGVCNLALYLLTIKQKKMLASADQVA